MTDVNQVLSLLTNIKALNSSLRLKDVLEATVTQFSELAGDSKIAVFLSDNNSLSLKLMHQSGYSENTLEQIRVLSFSSETLLKHVVQLRQPYWASDSKEAPDLSAVIMNKEGSKGQIGLPLLASNLLVGVVLLDLKESSLLERLELLKDFADLAAQAIANAILFGRSEYERERLGTLYKTSVALSGSSLKTAEVLQIAADTALFLANTLHCSILMLDPKKNSFVVTAFKGLDSNSLADFDLSMDDSLAGRCLANARTEYVSDATNIQRSLPRSAGGGVFASVLAVPIVYEHQALGAFLLFSTDTQGFHSEQIDLLESLAYQVGIALNIALTHESAASQTAQDAYTGLYNHWHFSETIGREFERSLRHKHELALLRIDIDHLSRVNELLGSDKGDEAIKHVAKVIKNCLRDIDVPCRYGSQEFVVILPETQRQSAQEVAERVRTKIRQDASSGVGMITVSIGLATFPDNGDEPSALLKAAEQALDIAKFEGRDRVKPADTGAIATDQVAWDELAKQAKLSLLSERQSKLSSGLAIPAEYAPWMRAIPGWGAAKKK